MHVLNSRRRRLRAVLAGVLAISVVLAGCSAAGDDPVEATGAPGSGDSRLPAAEGKVTYPLTLEGPFGETVLEERPERIAVATTTSDAENLIALGVQPVFIFDDYFENEWITDTAALDAVEVSAPTPAAGAAIPVEAIASSEPDLIIMVQSSLYDTYHEDFTAIAPVLTTREPSSDRTWEESITAIARALDLTDRAERIIQANDRLVSEALDDTPELRGEKVSVVMDHPTQGIQYRSQVPGPNAELFSKLGFEQAEFSSDRALEDSLSISPEQYPLIDADVLLVYASSEGRAELEDQEIFQTIPAVRGNSYAFIDQETFAYASLWPTALSLPYAIENGYKPAFAEISSTR